MNRPDPQMHPVAWLAQNALPVDVEWRVAGGDWQHMTMETRWLDPKRSAWKALRSVLLNEWHRHPAGALVEVKAWVEGKLAVLTGLMPTDVPH